MKINTYQFEGNKAKYWIEQSYPYLTWAGEYVLFSKGYCLALTQNNKLCIYSIEGTHALFELNNKQLNIMKEKEEHIQLLQIEYNEKEEQNKDYSSY